MENICLTQDMGVPLVKSPNLPQDGLPVKSTAFTRVVGGFAILGQVSLSRMAPDGSADPVTYRISALPRSLVGTTITLPVVAGEPLITDPPRAAMDLLRESPHLVAVLEAISRSHPDADGVVFTTSRCRSVAAFTVDVVEAGVAEPTTPTRANTVTVTSSQEQKRSVS